MKNRIKKLIINLIQEKYNIELKDIKLDNPPEYKMWDYAFGVFILAKELKQNPVNIAKELALLLNNSKLIESTSLAWPYINIKFNKTIFTKKFIKYSKRNNFYKKDKKRKKDKKKNIYIDYIWANVWKPMHIWHICPWSQWQVIINILKKLGYNVISDSHIWDWWIIFWKLITAYKLFWNEDEFNKNAVDHLFKIYVKITSESKKDETLDSRFRKEFKKLSEWNKDSVNLWYKFTKESILSMQHSFDRLWVKAKYNIWESFYEWLNLPKLENYPDLEYKMSDIVKELIKSKIATQNKDWSVWIIFSEESKLPSCILQKRDWTHWYLASDLAAIKYRKSNWNPKKIIYFVDIRQQLHFKQAFEIARLAWWLWKWKNKTKCTHAYNWFIKLKDWAMSTREWRIIRLEDLLNESETRSKKIILEKRSDFSEKELNNLSKKIWIWAIKYWYLKKNRELDSIFDWDEYLTFEWNSGPYIQYAYVRALNILNKANYKNSEIIQKLKLNKNIYFEKQEEIELAKKLLEFIKTLKLTVKWNYPSILCQYCYDLTKLFSSFYNKVHILNEKDKWKQVLRLELIKVFKDTLREWFELLWIEMPDKM